MLAAGLGAVLYLGSKKPREQHVRVVLGDRAADVTALELTYATPSGDVARHARLSFDAAAPRIVAHDPELADGDYVLRIEVDAREGRRSTERRVTLAGGTTQIDLVDVLSPSRSPKPRTVP